MKPKKPKMKTYTVVVKEAYVYEGVKAKNKTEALNNVILADAWCDCNNAYSTKVVEEKTQKSKLTSKGKIVK